MKEPHLIKRPAYARTGGRTPVYPYRAIEATLDTDRALRIPLNGRPAIRLISAIGRGVRRRGLVFRHRRERDSLAVWVERP